MKQHLWVGIFFRSVACLGVSLPLTPVLYIQFEGVTRQAAPQCPLLLSRNGGQHCLLMLPKKHLLPGAVLVFGFLIRRSLVHQKEVDGPDSSLRTADQIP